MLYRISKLARKISEDLELPMVAVWDILEELKFEPQELTEKQVSQWKLKVSREFFYK